MSEQPESTGVRRREFLKILGATGAATATLGCGTGDVERLIPYLIHPDQTVPGVSSYYATTCRECSNACGVIAEVRDGRTIKLEGNPDHPLNRGALCARGQAALQGLYNPDRYRGPMVRQGGRLVPTTWDQAMQLLVQRIGEARAGGRAANALFLNRHETGSFAAFLDSWLSAMGMPPALSLDVLAQTAVMEANRQSYGIAWPSLDFGAARLIVSFGADFLDDWGATIPQQLDFADARAKLATAPRMIYIGPRRSLTGLNADEWIACKPGAELAIARALQSGAKAGGGDKASVEQAAQQSGVPAAQLQRLAAEIAASKPSLLLAGARTANASELALTINSLNQSLGNVGATVKPTSPITSFDGTTPAAELLAAVERMRSGQVPITFVRGVNPAFTIPRAVDFAGAFARVPFKVAFSSYPDETSEMCDLVLPDHHPLESWGDATPVPGTIGLQQPTMEPVFNTRQTADVLLLAARSGGVAVGAGATTTWRDLFISRIPGGAAALTAALPRGLMPGSLQGAPSRRPAVAPAPTPSPLPPPTESAPGDFYLVVYPSSVLGDGSGANKPWLQELPDPVTKIAWQTWVEIHPLTAARLGIESGDLIRVSGPGGKAVEVPAYVYLGIRQDTVAMAFGRGHSAYGRYAKDVGVNPLDLFASGTDARVAGGGGGGGFAWTQGRVSLAKSDGYMHLATTEGSARQHGRGIGRALTALAGGTMREAAGGEHGEEVAPTGEKGAQTARPGKASAEQAGAETMPGDASHDFLPGLRSPLAADAQGDVASGIERKEGGMYSSQHWSGMAKRRWAMTIDLARCTGCSACVTACYAENNIPTTGAPYQSTAGLSRSATPGHTGLPGSNIVRGREMAWIRLERYYEGGEDGTSSFDTRFVPMLCQHCGNAPCEPVCPVYATYHSPDGLNVQVYNRCVGTRYCSNNCPYKVRYFNWFGYGEPHRAQYAWPEPLHWQLNPDVTVRGKGVMEKCTFCVQRIREAEHRAKAEGRTLVPDEFTVACAQACPSRAITFGDAADAGWTVAQLAQDARAYHVFEELNTYTAVVYLKKVNHPALGPDAEAVGGGT